MTRIPDETKDKGYNIVAGKLSFEFSKILDTRDIAPALVAMDVAKLGVVDGNGVRRLTIRECQRLCGYPDNYNLDMIISIGYRVNSKQGVAFRQWANKILKDYMLKGYA